jgi:hypothetical protein
MADEFTPAGQFQSPYLYGEAKSALETPMQGEAYTSGPEMESQWKQPWKHESYPKMEQEFAFPGAPGYQLPPGTYGPGVDCEPHGDAAGGGTNPCDPGVSCAVYMYSCAHKITKFTVIQDFGWIQSVQYLPGDMVKVTVCWNEADRTAGKKIGPKAILNNGKSVIAETDFSLCCPTNTACQKACSKCPALSIGYTSQQMSCSGTQALSATGGGGKYIWSMSGGGSLNKTTGTSVIYTAPSTNANCANNPTITLKDCCGNTKTLTIAINCTADTDCAYSTCVNVGGNKCTRCFTCAGALAPAGTACRCAPGANICWTTPNAACAGCTTSVCCAYEGGSCSFTLYDRRTAGQKAAGCCPQALL